MILIVQSKGILRPTGPQYFGAQSVIWQVWIAQFSVERVRPLVEGVAAGK